MSNFLADLKQGEAAEATIAHFLGSIYPECTWIKANKASKFVDLICSEHGESIEVKTDRKAATTGNVCYEANLFIFSRAQKVIYLIGDKAYSWNIDNLKTNLLVLTAKGLTRGLYGGDRNANALILAKLQDVAPFAEIYELTKEEE